MNKIEIVVPEQIKKLPIAPNGYPVPFFVAIVDGQPDFRVAGAENRDRCRSENLCWICGQPLTYWCAFAGGPLSMQSRHFSDGPMHVDCAEFSMKVCPHILNPNAKQRERGAPDASYHQSGTKVRPEYFALFICRLGKWDFLESGGEWIWRGPAPKAIRWFHAGNEIPDPYKL